MDQIISMLSAFGPYGVIAGIGVAVVWRWLRSRRPDLIPDPNAPLPDVVKFPFLSKLAEVFPRLKSVRDLTPDHLAAIAAEVEALAKEIHASAAAQQEAVAPVAKVAVPVKLP